MPVNTRNSNKRSFSTLQKSSTKVGEEGGEKPGKSRVPNKSRGNCKQLVNSSKPSSNYDISNDESSCMKATPACNHVTVHANLAGSVVPNIDNNQNSAATNPELGAFSRQSGPSGSNTLHTPTLGNSTDSFSSTASVVACRSSVKNFPSILRKSCSSSITKEAISTRRSLRNQRNKKHVTFNSIIQINEIESSSDKANKPPKKKTSSSLNNKLENNILKTDLSSENLCPCGNDFVSSTDSQKWLECSKCFTWFHTNCINLTDSELLFFRKPSVEYECPICTIHRITSKVTPELRSKIITQLYHKTSRVKAAVIENSDKNSTGAKSGEEVEQGPKLDLDTFSPDITKAEVSSQDQQLHVDKDLIVIIDNITNPKYFRTRRQILSEVNRCKPSLAVKFAYSLAGGGICLHLKSKSDRDLALDRWPTGAFNSASVIAHPPRKKSENTVVFASHIPEDLTEEQIRLSAEGCTQVRRLIDRYTKKPLKTVELFFRDTNTAKDITTHGLEIAGNTFPASPKQTVKIIRCYRCHRFGHTANTCNSAEKCVRCSKHHNTEDCSNPAQCANCSGRHPANSRLCPVYQELRKKLLLRNLSGQSHPSSHEDITAKCSLFQHITVPN